MIDANVILRYLLRDNESYAIQARKVISEGAFTTIEVIAEVIYVLQGVYLVPKTQIKNFINCLLCDISCEHSDVLVYALNVYERENLDFVDCLLIGYNKINGIEIFSFDKKLNKTLNNFTL